MNEKGPIREILEDSFIGKRHRVDKETTTTTTKEGEGGGMGGEGERTEKEDRKTAEEDKVRELVLFDADRTTRCLFVTRVQKPI